MTSATLNPFDFLQEQEGGDGVSANGSTAVMEPPVESPVVASVAESPKPAAATASAPATIPTKATRATRKPIYIDLETVPDETREHLFGLDPIPAPAVFAAEGDGPLPSELLKGTLDEIKAAIAKAQASGKLLPRTVLEGSLKMEQGATKPRKGVIDLFASMVQAIDGEADAIQEAIENRRKTMSVTPEMCRIVAMGWAVGGDPAEALVVGQSTADGKATVTEKMIIEKFWSLAGNHGPIVGYNVAGFDLPVLFVRSILLDIDSSKKIDRKDWGTDVVDLMKRRFPFGQAKRLKDLASLMGIAIPAEGVDGSQVFELYQKDPLKLGDYVRSDISITRALHKKYEGFFA